MSSSPSSLELEGDRKYIECEQCGKPDPQHRCARCQCAYYCNRQCQKAHWITDHKQLCWSVETMIEGLLGSKPLPHEMESPPTTCGICLEEPMVDRCILRGCQHGFCFKCLVDWQGYNKYNPLTDTEIICPTKRKSTCPICRHTVNQSVVMDVLDRATACRVHAERLEQDDPKRLELLEQALREVDIILNAFPEDIQGLFGKATVLLHIDNAEALRVCQELYDLDKKNVQNVVYFRMAVDKVFALRASGQHLLAHELKMHVEALVQDETRKPKPFAFGEEYGICRMYPLRIKMCKALEGLKKWGEAREDYTKMWDDVFSPDARPDVTIDGKQACEIQMGESRCWYHLGDYVKALESAVLVVQMDRRFPGGHKLVAMAQAKLQRAVPNTLCPKLQEALLLTKIVPSLTHASSCDSPQGIEIGNAIRTIHRGLLYEAPWYTENRPINQRYLQALLIQDNDDDDNNNDE